MPSFSNVQSPISIYGVGRSGSTLLQSIFHHLGWIQACNETIGLVMGAWSGAHFSPLASDVEAVGHGKHITAMRAVHGALINALPSAKGGWIQKLSGVPNNFVWEPFLTDEDNSDFHGLYPFPFRFYQGCLLRCFPSSKNILLVRNPLEIAISRASFSGWQREAVLVDVAVAYRACALMTRAHFDVIVGFDELRSQSEQTMAHVLQRVGIDWNPKVMHAFDHHHAPAGDSSFGSVVDSRRSAAIAQLESQPLSEKEVLALLSIRESLDMLGCRDQAFAPWVDTYI